MKPTVTINLAGIVYHIDNDAYDTLNAYLKDIEAHLEESDSKQEIMQDIESRIAELFSQHLKYSHIEVVNISMVNDIMAQLGSPEMITTGAETEEGTNTNNASDAATAETSTPQPTIKKKLYRNTDNQVLGGVCAGLAQFIGIDVIWLRLAIVLLLCLQGVGLIVYLLLWMIVPAANTAARRLEMRGIEPSAENIRAEVERQRENMDEYSNLKQNNNNGCLRSLLIGIIAIVCLPFAIALVAFLFAAIVAIVGLLIGCFGAMAGGASLIGILGIESNTLVMAILAILGALGVILIPIIVLIYWAVRRNKTDKPMKKSAWISALIIWIICLIFTFGCGMKTLVDMVNFADQNGIVLNQDDPDFGESLANAFATKLFDSLSEEDTFIVRGDTITGANIKQMIENEILGEGGDIDEQLLDSIIYQVTERLVKQQVGTPIGQPVPTASEGVLEVTGE